VILVGIGSPDTCETSAQELATLAVNGYANAGIRTYAIALDEDDTTTMDLIARAGGTRRAFPIPTETLAEDLVATLQAITGTKVRCEFDVRNAANINVDNAIVTYTPGDGSGSTTLTLVDNASDCGDGWYFDDPENPTTAALCPKTCDTVQADEKASIELAIGCPTSYLGDEYTETYTGTCTTGGLQWGFFTYETEIEAGAEILFEVRTAPTEAELATATWSSLATATDALQSCGLGGPLPACPVNVYDAVGGGSAAKNPSLELRATLTPGSSGTSKAVLNSWRLTYTCQDNE
jgi:hypothetical protein